MSNDIQMEKSVRERPPLQKWAVVGVIAFFIFAIFISSQPKGKS